ncbi:serine hydrolase [Ruegeria sp. EL01]|jgi:beta-lactamase class C|uniref:serine hydrolase n=1 Tax=Ruegeria sp. EL01 TaxID=2107578 RepID=UPI000EA801C7|nr:serine hydrolase [Ruegeria sp. EL01]
MKKIGLLVSLLFSFSTALPAQVVTKGKVADLAEHSFSSVVASYDIPGLVVGVTMRGEHYFYATGLASREENIAATPDTIFELGSVSKIFNVSLAALAEQRGKLELGSAVSDRVAELRESAFDDIRLMDLATHTTGGLPLQVPTTVQDVPDLIDWLADWQPQQEGTRSYSNIGIGLLGHITSDALGMSYSEATEQVLFPAMGLESTSVDVPEGAMDRYAFGYDRKTNEPIRVNPGVLDAEAYGLKSTARDMLRLLDLELGHTGGSSELSAALERTRQGQTKTPYYVQGMIWEQYPWPVSLKQMEKGAEYNFVPRTKPVERFDPPIPPQRDVILNKTGSTNGFGAYVALLPGEDLGIVVLANRN